MSMSRASSRCLETAPVICFATLLARRLGTATVLGLAAVSVQAQSPVAFPMQYVAQQDGRRDVLVPEAFELATILLVTSEWGRGDGRRSPYSPASTSIISTTSLGSGKTALRTRSTGTG